ncbi:MAG: TlpA disulfide reductase family protein [Oryzomonas sp.]|uniref:peroxiredoxin family protein n=1 Tax=Oryzomonas sp. TaxID=2855186 RepID=UPI002841118D|nr:TlpA disulfide reductase family protein [Oryzomonas sp.]MDR3581169.1 TlpA disulfide reductase family protein [Oryzomonas sp.]
MKHDKIGLFDSEGTLAYYDVRHLQDLYRLTPDRERAAKKPESGMSPRFQRFFMALVLLLASIVCMAGCEVKPEGHTGEKAPEIAGTDLHGEPISLGRLRGSVVVLCFWTNSCCSDRLKLLEPYKRQNKDKGLVILAINEGNARESVASYAKANSLTFPVLTDEGSMTAKEYGVFGFPTIFIIDRKGIIRKKILGDVNPAQLDKLVRQIAKL